MKIFSLPNIITLLNLFFGCLTVLLLVENNLEIQYIFVPKENDFSVKDCNLNIIFFSDSI